MGFRSRAKAKVYQLSNKIDYQELRYGVSDRNKILIDTKVTAKCPSVVSKATNMDCTISPLVHQRQAGVQGGGLRGAEAGGRLLKVRTCHNTGSAISYEKLNQLSVAATWNSWRCNSSSSKVAVAPVGPQQWLSADVEKPA